MDPVRKGDITENRVHRALLELQTMHPEFVQDVRVAPPAVDARGIDFLVRIGLPAGISKKTMTVPIEAKSSLGGVKKLRVVHSDLHKAGVLIVYVPSWWWSPRKLRRLLYRALRKVQSNSRNGNLYDGLFQRLFVGGSRNLDRIITMIKKHRAG